MGALRRRRGPATAAALAEELRVSVRTVYRDVATLVGEGAPIEGEAGLGYVLRPGFFLPPLNFDADECDALVLGLRFAIRRGDPGLAAAAERALGKVLAGLPEAEIPRAVAAPLLAGPPAPAAPQHLAALRRAMRAGERLVLSYRDRDGRASLRRVWPVAVGFFESVEVLAAWCELRGAFRHFRLDRIAAVTATGERMPRTRAVLLAEWRAAEGLRNLA